MPPLNCQAISIEPNYVDAHNNLGSVLYELDRLEDAAESYKKALAIDSNDVEGQYNLGFILQSLGQFNEAIDRYQQVLKINPNYVDAHNNLGVILSDLERFEDALRSYKKAITISPNYHQAHNNIGNVLVELGQSDKALKSYRKALEVNPEYAEAHNNLGGTLKNLGQLDEAINCYKKAIEYNPNYSSAHLNLSALKKFTTKDSQYIQMQDIYSFKNTSELDRIKICFALAKANENLAKKDDFFKFLDEANYLRKKDLNYSIDKDQNDHLMLKSLFSDTEPQILKEGKNIKAKKPIYSKFRGLLSVIICSETSNIESA